MVMAAAYHRFTVATNSAMESAAGAYAAHGRKEKRQNSTYQQALHE